MNTLVVIGRLGDYECYLNLTKDDAIQKYFEKYPTTESNSTTREIHFENSFGVFGNLKNY